MTGYAIGDATIERGLVLRKLGRLADEDRAAMRQVIKQISEGAPSVTVRGEVISPLADVR